MDDRIRILLADDYALLRETISHLLNSQPDMEIVAEAASASDVLRLEGVNPQVILLGMTSSSRGSIAILPELRRQFPDARVLLLCMPEEPSYLRAALAAGAVGYLVKSSSAAVLLEAIRAVRHGEQYIDVSMREHVSELAKAVRSPEAAPIARLSERERQVMLWLAQGLRYQAIADKMGVSVKTVETYRSRLTAKLGFKNRADLMRFAIESGLLTNLAQEPQLNGAL